MRGRFIPANGAPPPQRVLGPIGGDYGSGWPCRTYKRGIPGSIPRRQRAYFQTGASRTRAKATTNRDIRHDYSEAIGLIPRTAGRGRPITNRPSSTKPGAIDRRNRRTQRGRSDSPQIPGHVSIPEPGGRLRRSKRGERRPAANHGPTTTEGRSGASQRGTPVANINRGPRVTKANGDLPTAPPSPDTPEADPGSIPSTLTPQQPGPN